MGKSKNNEQKTIPLTPIIQKMIDLIMKNIIGVPGAQYLIRQFPGCNA